MGRRRRGLTAFRDEVCILESAREEPGEGAERRLERRDRRHVVRDERLVRHPRRDARSHSHHHHGSRPARAVRSPHRQGMALHPRHRRPKGQPVHPTHPSSSPTPSRSSSPPAPPPCTNSSSSLKPSNWPKSPPPHRNASSRSVISRTGWCASATSSPNPPLHPVLQPPTQSSLPPISG